METIWKQQETQIPWSSFPSPLPRKGMETSSSCWGSSASLHNRLSKSASPKGDGNLTLTSPSLQVVPAFQVRFPERGWKLCSALGTDIRIIFPSPLPRKGMETREDPPNYQPRGSCFPSPLPRKGMET